MFGLFSEVLRPASPDVVITIAKSACVKDAAQLGKLVGRMRPNHTSVVFEAKAAAASVLQHRDHRKAVPRLPPIVLDNAARALWPYSNRTGPRARHQSANSSKLGTGGRRRTTEATPRSRRAMEDPEGLCEGLGYLGGLRLENDALGGDRPIELLKEGKARDIIVEFRRLQAGEPA